MLSPQSLRMDHDPTPAKDRPTEHERLLAERARHRRDVVVGVDATAAAGLWRDPVFLGPVQAGAGEAQPRPGLAFRTEHLQRRPQGLRYRRLQPAAGPGVIRIHPPEAIADGGNHAGVVAGT